MKIATDILRGGVESKNIRFIIIIIIGEIILVFFLFIKLLFVVFVVLRKWQLCKYLWPLLCFFFFFFTLSLRLFCGVYICPRTTVCMCSPLILPLQPAPARAGMCLQCPEHLFSALTLGIQVHCVYVTLYLCLVCVAKTMLKTMYMRFMEYTNIIKQVWH